MFTCTDESLLAHLQQGMRLLPIELSLTAQDTLLHFLILLQKWNAVFNLTAWTALEDMLVHHIFDSLSVAPYLIGKRILDFGTGAGLPGLPLALAFPEKEFFLIDSQEKKIHFLQHVKQILKIPNIVPVCARVTEIPFICDTCVTRAVGSVAYIVKNSRFLIARSGRLLMMKGALSHEEFSNLHLPYIVFPVQVPEIDAPRNVVCVDF